MTRLPNRYVEYLPKRHQKKWDEIILAFRRGDLNKLLTIQRTGTRGHIFYNLVKEMLEILHISFRPEPVFEHVPPDPWYVDFAHKHDLTLRVHPFYNPDFFLEDGTWIEVTLSENSAYKKLFRYGHQTQALLILWLDPDQGLHSNLCRGVFFQNAKITSIRLFYDELAKSVQGEELIWKFEWLAKLKGTLL